MSTTVPHCATCNKPQADGSPLKQCAKCKKKFYCNEVCQKKDWRSHKVHCIAPRPGEGEWYDSDTYRKCGDGSGEKHEGKLELITWNTPADPKDDDSDELGWGNVLIEEAEEHKKKFEEEFGSDPVKMYEYWPQAFRWTCCGADADMLSGCDHHGTGSRPCSCDYCRGGKPIPSKVYNEVSASRMGLTLSRGPDPRSRLGF